MPLLDEYAGNADLFPVLRRWNYLNHGGVSPLPRCVADAVRRFADCFEAGGYLGGAGFDEIEKCRIGLAKLINAQPAEVALLKNTAEAISTVAFGLDWQPGDRVVTAAVEYPCNIYPWMELSRRFGVEVVMVPERDCADGCRRVDPDELLAAAGDSRCRMIALSQVQFASGQHMPMERIGRFCRENGKLFCVDAIQALGALPVDVAAMNIDFLAAGSQKWLLGPMGAAMLYIRAELMDHVRPLAIGAYSVVDPDNYGDYNYTLAGAYRRHESGTPNFAAVMGLRAAVDMLLSVGIGSISRRVMQLTDHLIEKLAQRGYRIVSPRGDGERSGIVSFLPANEQDLGAIARRLRKDHKIEIVVRENRLRACPHFYNTIEQMDALVMALN